MLRYLPLFLALTAPAQTFVKVANEGSSPATAPVVTLAAGSTYRWGVSNAAVGATDTGSGPWCNAVTVTQQIAIAAYNWPIPGANTPVCQVADIDPGVIKSLEVASSSANLGGGSGTTSTSGTAVILSGADPTGKLDSLAAFNSGVTAAIASGLELFVPAGHYIVSGPIVANSSCFAMRGAPGSVITASNAGYDDLIVGPGTVNSVTPCAYVKGIEFHGAGRPSSATGTACIQVNGVVQFDGEGLACYDNDIGIDAVGDSYGATWKNLRMGFGNLNVGVYLRDGGASGSDITFENLWANGVFCAVCIAGNGGNYHFHGGQLSASPSNVNDGAGSVVIGYDYLTGATGGAGADFSSVSFEGTQNAWVIRDYTSALVLNSSSINPAEGVGALGVFKGTNMQNAQVAFHDTGISGIFTTPQLLVVQGSYTQNGPGDIDFVETNTVIASNAPTINGKKVYGNLQDASGTNWTSMFGQSGLQALAYIQDKSGLMVAGVRK